MTQQSFIPVRGFIERLNMLTRYYQEMTWSLRIDVTNDNAKIVLIQ